MPLGFLLLTVHWFNPLMWLSYILLCRDIEMACDERVVGPLDKEQRVDYSRALLTCSVDRRMVTACPLAFGEVRVKERIKSVLRYKKPAVGMIAAAMVVCAVLAVCFLTSPAGVPDDADLPEGTKQVSELAFEQLDGSQPGGVGFELIYESEDLVIFYGSAGLFGYDLEKREMVLGIDFVKAYGKEGMVQGEYGTYAEASADGNTIVFTYTDPDAPEVSQDAYYIDLSTMTYRTGAFQPLADVFDRETAVGYVMPGGSILTSKYVRGDETWNVFEGYAA